MDSLMPSYFQLNTHNDAPFSVSPSNSAFGIANFSGLLNSSLAFWLLGTFAQWNYRQENRNLEKDKIWITFLQPSLYVPHYHALGTSIV